MIALCNWTLSTACHRNKWGWGSPVMRRPAPHKMPQRPKRHWQTTSKTPLPPPLWRAPQSSRWIVAHGSPASKHRCVAFWANRGQMVLPATAAMPIHRRVRVDDRSTDVRYGRPNPRDHPSDTAHGARQLVGLCHRGNWRRWITIHRVIRVVET